jgi:hypothetical protein
MFIRQSTRSSKCIALLSFFVLTATFLMLGSNLESAPLRNISVTKKQPDGTALALYASGDEFHNWLHDHEGYTIIQDPQTGYYVYALKQGDTLVPSRYRAGNDKPEEGSLEKGVNVPPKAIEAKISEQRLLLYGSSAYPSTVLDAPKTGILNNLVVFVRFADQNEYNDAIEGYDTLLNSSGPETPSLYNYYREVSYNQLAISSTFYPLPNGGIVRSYQDAHPMGYYQPYNSLTNPIGYRNTTERRDREHTLLKNAIDAISASVPLDLDIDRDQDGYVDHVSFVVRGGTTFGMISCGRINGRFILK